MKRYLFLFISLSITLFAFSGSKEHFVTLAEHSEPILNAGFNLLKITNATGASKRIGFVEKTIGYKDVPAYFEKPIEDELFAYISRNLKSNNAENDLILRVNILQISESYDGINEKARVKIELSFIYKIGTKYFEKFSVKTVTEKFQAAGITKHQPSLIAEAISECFAAFYERSKDGKLSDIEISVEELSTRPEPDNEKVQAYLSADRSIKGIYKSYIDFRENTPDYDADFDVEYKTKSTSDETITIKYARLTESGTGYKIKDIWGFTDGKASYALFGKKFMPLHKGEKGFYFELKMQDDATMSSAVILGGLIGAGIAAAAAPIRKIRIDYTSGIFDFSGQEELISKPETPGFTIKFLSSIYNKESSELELYINEKYRCTLQKQTWYEYEMSTAGEVFTIKVISTNGLETTKEIRAKTYNQDVYLFIDKKKKEPVIHRVGSNKIDGINNLMTPENRNYGQDRETDTGTIN